MVERFEREEADYKGECDADEGAEVGNEIEDEGEDAPEWGVGEADEPSRRRNTNAEGEIDEGDGLEVGRDPFLDVVGDLDGAAFVFESGNNPHELAEKAVS